MFLIIILFLIIFYIYGTRNFGYWKQRGVKHDVPLPYVGNNFKQFVQKASLAMTANDVYKKYPNEKVVGFYRGTMPELVIRDPEIAKRILTIDFHNFYARGICLHKTVIEPLLRNLFFADGDLWKLLRQKFTPVFSTAKLKAMFPIITERAKKLQVIIEDVVLQDSYDARELMARYTTDFIGVCGFGLNIDCLSDENSQFRRIGKRIFQRTFRDAVAGALKTMFPETFKNMNLLSPEIERSMVYLVQTVMKERNFKSSGKNDFIDLLLEIRQNKIIVGESIEKRNPNGTPVLTEIELDDLLLTAQVFVFFGAGFETSSGASSYTLHQLAFNPECQEKAQRQIDRVLAKYNNEITYDAIKEMTYVEMVFKESLRMFPPVAYLIRQCVASKYTIPEIDVTIDEDVKVLIPIAAIQNDEKYFENPNQFIPERFEPDSKDDIQKYVYMPFGEGPRACVGERLGQMQSIAGLVSVLQKFTVEPAACTQRYPHQDPAGIVAESFVGGLPLKFRKRDKTH